MSRAASRAVELYGGAVTARVPARFRDLSDVAPVPDHQEVFFDDALEESLHVELVERDGESADALTLARGLFHDWLDACDGASTSEVTVDARVDGARAWTRASGAMRARRENGRTRDVDVHGGVIDLADANARALIWHCRPYAYDGGRVAPSGTEAAPSAFAGAASDGRDVAPSEVLRECVESFTIVDASLFG